MRGTLILARHHTDEERRLDIARTTSIDPKAATVTRLERNVREAWVQFQTAYEALSDEERSEFRQVWDFRPIR